MVGIKLCFFNLFFLSFSCFSNSFSPSLSSESVADSSESDSISSAFILEVSFSSSSSSSPSLEVCFRFLVVFSFSFSVPLSSSIPSKLALSTSSSINSSSSPSSWNNKLTFSSSSVKNWVVAASSFDCSSNAINCFNLNPALDRLDLVAIKLSKTSSSSESLISYDGCRSNVDK